MHDDDKAELLRLAQALRQQDVAPAPTIGELAPVPDCRELPSAELALGRRLAAAAEGARKLPALHPTVQPWVQSNCGKIALCIPLAGAGDVGGVPPVLRAAVEPWRAVQLAQDLLHGALAAHHAGGGE